MATEDGIALENWKLCLFRIYSFMFNFVVVYLKVKLGFKIIAGVYMYNTLWFF